MRILGIDYGDVRVGLAMSDALGITAQGLETINYKEDKSILFKRLKEIIDEYKVNTIVVGMPINMNGTSSKRVEVTKEFIELLKEKYKNIKIETIDERLTTVQAHNTMNALNINKKKKKNLVDTISAVYILETYMSRII